MIWHSIQHMTSCLRGLSLFLLILCYFTNYIFYFLPVWIRIWFCFTYVLNAIYLFTVPIKQKRIKTLCGILFQRKSWKYFIIMIDNLVAFSIVTNVFVTATLTKETSLSTWREFRCNSSTNFRQIKAKVNFALEQVIKASRGSSGIALLFL